MIQLIDKMKVYHIISFLFLCILLNSNFAQKKSIDSLKQVLFETRDDTSKAKLLVQIAKSIVGTDKEQAIKYYIEASKLETNKKKKAVIFNTIGLYNWQLGNYNNTREYYKESLALFEEINDSGWIGRVCNNYGIANWGLGNGNKALYLYQKGLKIRKAIKEWNGVAIILNNIGIIYQDWGLHDDALKWHNEALEISLEIKNTNSTAYSYANLGKCYENKLEYKTALKYYQLGYKTLQKNNKITRSNTLFLVHIGDIYEKTNDFDNAIKYYKESLKHAKRINNKNRIAISEYCIGRTYFELGKIDSVDKYINSSYKKSTKNGFADLIKNTQFLLSKIEEQKGNISKAFHYFKSATALKDSLFTKEKIAKFTNLQVKYNLGQKTRENENLRKNSEIQQLTISQQNNIRNIFMVGSIVILISLILITKSRVSQKKLNVKLKESEKNLLELNRNKDKFFSIISHDLKSPFNGILGATEMLVSDYDELTAEEAKEMIQIVRESSTKAYELLEGLLEWAQTQTGRMKYEFENIDVYEQSSKIIDLIKINAKNKNILLENNVEENTFVFADQKATETVLRNLIANAIKFTQPDGTIKIETEKRVDEIAISVSDNGIGMSEENKNKLFKIEVHHTTVGTNNEAGTGVGLILCKELVEKNNGKIWVESELGNGSKFTFTLPKSSTI